MHADVVVFTGKFEFHRLPGNLGQYGGHIVVVLRLIFIAEAAAHVLADDSHFAQRQGEIFGDVGARVGDALSRSEYGELASVPLGDADAPFHLGVIHMLGNVSIFEDPIGFT